ncbi:Delta2-dienoyl-CoA-isomerase [Amanita rubescens]|nr:Delta2-dienoyl-CoA-isomerase [Amanita rubescens]KAF8345035.1 Delta2-dienoyl-CoA-isomerase [Amanita rubescens]
MTVAHPFTTKWIKVSEPHSHVYHVELSRTPMNAFSTEFWKDYEQVFRKLNESDARAVVLSSALPNIFTAGIDLNDDSLGMLESKPNSPDTARSALALRQHLLDFQSAISTPDRCSFPVIAACHGHVIGLGIDIIAACDIRYAAAKTTFSIKEVAIGLAPDIGTLAFLPKITGNQSLLRELTYTARNFDVVEAEKLGLLSKVVQGGREEVIAAALDLAKEISSKSPVAVSSSKHLISHARDNTVYDNLRYTTMWNASQLMTEDISENRRAVKSKNSPNFKPLKAPAKL